MEREEESRVVAKARKVEEDTLAEEARANTRLIDDERLRQISEMGTAAYVEEAMEAVDKAAEAEALEEEAYEEEAYEEEALEAEALEEEALEEEALEEEALEEEETGEESCPEALTVMPGPSSPPAFIGPEPPPPPQAGLFPRISQPPPVKQRVKRLKPRELREFEEPEPEISFTTSSLATVVGSLFNKKVSKGSKTKAVLKLIPLMIVGVIILIGSISGALDSNKKSTSTSSSKTNAVNNVYYVSIDSPGKNATFAEETVTVSGKVKDYSQKPVGGASVTISVNSTGTVSCTTGTDGIYSAPVILGEGKNSIKVMAVKVASKGSNSISCYRVDEAQPPAEPVPVNP